MLVKPNENRHIHGHHAYKLAVFENFKIDYNLPKNKTPQTQPISGLSVSSGVNWVTTNSTIILDAGATSSGFVTRNTTNVSTPVVEKEKLFQRLKKWWIERQKPSIEETFNAVASAAQKVSFQNRMTDVQEFIDKALHNGQTALAEKLKKNLEVIKMELALNQTSFDTFVTEEKLVEFSYNSQRGLRLDWIENFTRLIPQSVLIRRDEANKLKVFDNYVILHYDPKNRSTEMTEAEKRKARDPILFGVSRLSRRLYFIGDWKDELCDLTMDDIIQKFGKEALTL
jgi:hypothetical protein